MMKLKQRFRDLIMNKNGLGIKTRYPMPFSIKLEVGYNDEELTGEEKEALADQGYERSPYYIYKTYGPKRYSKGLLGNFLQDIDLLSPPWFKGQCIINLIPNNISSYEDSKFITSLFHSINNVFPFMSPFWFYYWADAHDDVNTMVTSLEGDSNLSSVKYESASKIISLKGTQEDGYKIEIGYIYNHPSMVLSGISIIQSIIARAFYQEYDDITSEIYITGQGCDDLWSKIKTTSYLIQSMNAEAGEMEFKSGEDFLVPDESIPGLGGNTYYEMNNVFIDILREYTRNTGTFKDRCSKLALSFWRDGNEEHKPINNKSSLYKVLEDDFSWENGPEVR